MSRHRVKKTPKSLVESTPSTPVRHAEDMLAMDEEGSLIHLEQDGEGDVGDVGDVDNYRRFSSRMRRKTDFYVSLLADENGDDDSNNSGSSSGGRRRKIPSVARKLSFENYTYQSPLVAPRPDILVGDNSDCCLEVRSGENQGIKEDTLTKVMIGSEKQCASPSQPHTTTKASGDASPTSSEGFPVGSMVWGKLPGYDWWPGLIISYSREEGETRGDGEGDGGMQVWVKWYGESNLSAIATEKMALFSNFTEYFNAHSLKGVYRKGVFLAIKEAARRSKVEFQSHANDKTASWKLTDNFSEPTLLTVTEGEGEKANVDSKDTKSEETGAAEPKSNGKRKKKRRAGRGEKGSILINALEKEMLFWAIHGFLPKGPAGLIPTSEQNVAVEVVPVQSGKEGKDGGRGGGGGGDEEEPPKKKAKVMLLQVKRKAHFDAVLQGKMKISDLCIVCGAIDILADHPLFEGSLCKDCKDMFLECTYLFDEDGTQMYCCICSEGEEVFMCDAENCAKVYCGNCIQKLCGAPELDKVKAAAEWLCYMCSSDSRSVGLLTRRHDWDRKLQELFQSDHEEYASPPTYPPIEPEFRRPIRVLGLFDGIGTGLLVLKELGIDVDTYIASEIDQDAIKVSRVWHHEAFHIGDISKITETEIQALGPFDLVIGGSPCNDLSIVNPARKGIYEGTGRLFFEFFRILSYVRLCGSGDHPLFWLYENVVSMRAQDKQTISRFLQCNPMVVDAKDISATHRARYFWGNIPGMNRAVTPLPGDRLTLQDCLEQNCSRFARFSKLRTITTKMNSIKQTKAAIYPVRVGPLMGGEQQPELSTQQMQGDVLWCTEMERLFGFPDHYTDVANLGRSGRQRLLGKAWSVPVLRHLLSPLKDYFRSNTTRDRKSTTPTTTNTTVTTTTE